MPQFQDLVPRYLLGVTVPPLTGGSGVSLGGTEAASGGFLGSLSHSHCTCVGLGTRISYLCQLAAVVYKCVYFPGVFQLGWAEAGSQGMNERGSSPKQTRCELKAGDPRGLEPRTAPRQHGVNAKSPNPGAPICQPLLLSPCWEGWLSTSISLNLFLQSPRTRSSSVAINRNHRFYDQRK